VGSALHDFAVIDHANQIRIFNRRHAMRHDQSRTS
jgi:hypothetical protein